MLQSSVLAGDHDNDLEFPLYGINSLVIFVDIYRNLSSNRFKGHIPSQLGRIINLDTL